MLAAGTSGSSYANIEFKSDDTIQFISENSAVQFQLVTTQVFRDPSAWYNIHIIYDSANATSTDRIQLWINGVRVTAFSTATYPTTTPNNLFNTAIAHQIGVLGYGSVAYFDGYQTELNFIDGQALTPSSFGQTDAVTGVWQPKKYAGTYGTNGFFLNFSDNTGATATTIGADYSGNGNNWTPNNISVTAGGTYDSMLDVPTQFADGGNGRGNYCVMNPLDGVLPTVTNGNLQASIGAGTSSIDCSTFAVTSGKWYWEVSPSTISNNAMRIGVSDFSLALSGRLPSAAGGWAYVSTGNKVNNGTSVAYGSAYTTSNIIGVALDMDTGTLEFFEDGVSQGVAYSTGLAGKLIGAAITSGTGVGAQAAAFNFGQRPFAYTPPTGFKALNTLNLPTPTILKGNQYFDANLYTGNGATQSIVNSGAMQPDLVWVKKRSGVDNHELQDAVRGAGKRLASNTTDAEANIAAISSFNSNGFSVGNFGTVNENGFTYVGWQWRANGTPAVTNTAGSITSTVSAGATQGFSVVTYTGNATNNATIGHGLGVAPAMVITKNRAASTFWYVFHVSLPATNNLYLNTTDAQQADNVIRSTNSTTFTVSSSSAANGTSMVAYCFAPVAGFSAFGSYTGNGSTDGTFVYTGFRPEFVMIKRTDSVGSWWMLDSARDPFNLATKLQRANESLAEETSYASMDMLSNGFKLRVSVAESNANGGTYIYMAFAENPFKNALAR